MKTKTKYRKYLKRTVLAMAVILAVGLFYIGDFQTAYGIPAEYNITATANNSNYGTVTGAGIYATPYDVNLVATPKTGCRFVNWTEGTTVVSTNSAYSFVASTDRTLVANFATIAKPVITSAASGGYDSAKLTWSKVTGAYVYDVFRATSAGGTYKKIGSTDKTTYTASGLTTGKTYYFKITASCIAGTTVTSSSYSSYKAVTPMPAKPVAKAASSSYTTIKVSWDKVAGATGYKVYRATSSKGTYSSLGTTSSLYYKNTKVTTGKTYYYKVIAYRTLNGATYKSKSSAVVSAKAIPGTTTISKVITKTSTSSKIYWTGVSGATKYQIFRSTSAKGTYSWVYTASASARSYVNTGLTNGKTYYYKIRTYHLEGKTKVYGKSSAIKSVELGSAYYSGVYKVGTQIPAGEYYLKGYTEDDAYVTLSRDAVGNDVVGETSPYPNSYVTLKLGQYVKFEDLKAYPIAKAPLAPKDKDGNLISAQYKVGRDIPAGEYVLIPATDDGILLQIDKDSTLISYPVGIDMVFGMTYVTVKDGQYLYLYCEKGYNLTNANAPKADITSGVLKDGMYKVGRDFPAGTYTLTPSVWGAQYLIKNVATHPVDDFMNGIDLLAAKDVTLTDGQYIFLSDCTLTLK